MSQSISLAPLSVVLAASASAAHPARAADAATTFAEWNRAVLLVSRGDGAEGCPSAPDLGEQVVAIGGGTARDGAVSVIHVVFGRSGGDYTAELAVAGGALGARSLRAPGPGCERLERALVAALTLLLEERAPSESARDGDDAEGDAKDAIDGDGRGEREAGAAADPPVERRPPAGPAGARARTISKSSAPSDPRDAARGSVFAAAGLTAGLAGKALTWSGADLWITTEGLPWAISVGGWMTLEATARPPVGDVDFQWMGGQTRLCWIFGERRGIHVLPCAAFAAGTLRASATSSAATFLRPFFAPGASAILRGPLLGPAEWSLDGAVLFPFRQERITVGDMVVFETSPVGVWLALGVGMQIW